MSVLTRFWRPQGDTDTSLCVGTESFCRGRSSMGWRWRLCIPCLCVSVYSFERWLKGRSDWKMDSGWIEWLAGWCDMLRQDEACVCVCVRPAEKILGAPCAQHPCDGRARGFKGNQAPHKCGALSLSASAGFWHHMQWSPVGKHPTPSPPDVGVVDGYGGQCQPCG